MPSSSGPGTNSRLGAAGAVAGSMGSARAASNATGSTSTATTSTPNCGASASAAKPAPTMLPAVMPRLQQPWQVLMIALPVAFSTSSAVMLSPSSSVDMATPLSSSPPNSQKLLPAKPGRQTATKKAGKP